MKEVDSRHTLMLIIGVEVEDAFNEVLIEHARMPLHQQVNQAKLS